MAEYIDRKALRDALYDADAITMNGVKILNQFPTADVAPVQHGKWENVQETDMYVPEMKFTITKTAETCSVCKARVGFVGAKQYLFDSICLSCGARMDLEV